jgi:Fic family protein
MAEQLLDRILREVRNRKSEARAAFEETQRLQAALAALDSRRDTGTAAGRQTSRRTQQPRRERGRRAPRGENLRRIREAVEQRPGATAGEVAAATGIARATVASTLGKLARAGELDKTELPGGGVGYRAASAGKDELTPLADTAEISSTPEERSVAHEAGS